MQTLRNLCQQVFGHPNDHDHHAAWLEFERRLLASDVLVSSRREKSQRNPDTCCKGLVALMENDPTADDGWKPKRCSRGCLPGSEYCKTHGRDVSQQLCEQCTEHFGHEVRHTILHQHFGVVGAPSYHFQNDKFRAKIIRNTLKEKINKSKDSQLQDNNNTTTKGKKSKKVRKIREGIIVPNAFMSWLKVHRADIKAQIQTQNPTMSARELMVSTTKRAGELWKLLSKNEQDAWKSPQANNTNDPATDILQIIHQTPPETPLTQCDDETPSSIALSVEDDDSVNLTFNDTHKVWVEEDTGLYYKDNNPDQAPIGQIVAGKLVPFKKNAKRVN
jgi:hypothetical protein